MKKIVVFILFLIQMGCLQAQWTVHSVPNTRLQGDEIHVSDPDGFLSDSAERIINMALDSIRSQADVFVVTLASIGDADPKHFATRLFNYWGIGDDQTDNGVLLLFVEDQHALEFETGYGSESTLTDARCARIFNNTIVPYFKAGDYEGGLCAGVADIVEVYGGQVPVGLVSNTLERGEQTTYEEYDYDDDISGISILFVLLFLPVPFISFFRWLVGLFKRKKKKDAEEALDTFEQDGIHYINGLQTTWSPSVWEGKGFLRFLLYGVMLFVLWMCSDGLIDSLMPEATYRAHDRWATWTTILSYLSLTCVVQNTMLLRHADKKAKRSKNPNGIYKKAKEDSHSRLARVLAPWFGMLFSLALKKRMKGKTQCTCPTCGAKMVKDGTFHLPDIRVAENDFGSYRYTPLRCPSGHLFVLREEGSNYKQMMKCEKCGALALKKIKERTVTSASYQSSGLIEFTYECQYCHASHTSTVTISKLTHSSYSSSGSSYSSHSSSSGRSYHSSSHSRGSFGGGRSGGGGYSGRW